MNSTCIPTYLRAILRDFLWSLFIRGWIIHIALETMYSQPMISTGYFLQIWDWWNQLGVSLFPIYACVNKDKVGTTGPLAIAHVSFWQWFLKVWFPPSHLRYLWPILHGFTSIWRTSRAKLPIACWQQSRYATWSGISGLETQYSPISLQNISLTVQSIIWFIARLVF